MNPTEQKKYVAFLRGINVGGHHKVPMADLRKELGKLDFKNSVTLLNSGNIIFETTPDKLESLEKLISENLEKKFGFPIPAMVRNAETIIELINQNPFQNINVTEDTRLYVSVLRGSIRTDLDIPWSSTDNSFTILKSKDNIILSVLDLSISKTPKAMEVLEKFFGKDVTTRNWKTIVRIVDKL